MIQRVVLEKMALRLETSTLSDTCVDITLNELENRINLIALN
jgi:hypothetical protein